MHRYTAVLSVLLMSGFLFVAFTAQEDVNLLIQDSRTRSESITDFIATFTYEVAQPTTRPSTQTGVLRYKKGMYAVSFPDQEIFCDQQNIWTYLKAENQVNIASYDPRLGVSVESIFYLFQPKYNPRFDGETEVHGIPCYKVYVSLNDPGLEYVHAYIWINKNTRLLEKVSLINRRQLVTSYEFTNLQPNQGLSDGAFRFDLSRYKGISVFDER
ncbi:MAG: outer membrane lipoprotein carrier protein LolA [Bacteroidia bacterium]|nr:outer membrane lipoprotein carrier protein LolA [Bacteroidia bacterium]